MLRFKYKKRILTALGTLLFVYFFIAEKNKIQSEPAESVPDLVAPADCGVVLTGSAGRIRDAFEVLNLGKVKKLIISGVFRGTKLHEIFPLLPYYPRINPEDIILEKISGSTYGNAVQSQMLAETLKCKDILLMTSHLHMYRAYRTFRANFPAQVKIRKFSVGSRDDRLIDVGIETFKSLFYFVLAPL